MALDRPASGRIFFEQLIRDNLDIGRPDKVEIVFGRQDPAARQEPHPRDLPDPGDHRRRLTPTCTCSTRTPQVKQYLNYLQP